MSLYATGATLVWGENVHTHNGFSIGLNWHFRTGLAGDAGSHHARVPAPADPAVACASPAVGAQSSCGPPTDGGTRPSPR